MYWLCLDMTFSIPECITLPLVPTQLNSFPGEAISCCAANRNMPTPVATAVTTLVSGSYKHMTGHLCMRVPGCCPLSRLSLCQPRGITVFLFSYFLSSCMMLAGHYLPSEASHQREMGVGATNPVVTGSGAALGFITFPDWNSNKTS